MNWTVYIKIPGRTFIVCKPKKIKHAKFIMNIIFKIVKQIHRWKPKFSFEVGFYLIKP